MVCTQSDVKADTNKCEICCFIHAQPTIQTTGIIIKFNTLYNDSVSICSVKTSPLFTIDCSNQKYCVVIAFVRFDLVWCTITITYCQTKYFL